MFFADNRFGTCNFRIIFYVRRKPSLVRNNIQTPKLGFLVRRSQMTQLPSIRKIYPRNKLVVIDFKARNFLRASFIIHIFRVSIFVCAFFAVFIVSYMNIFYKRFCKKGGGASSICQTLRFSMKSIDF